MILTDADQLREALRLALVERDEARARLADALHKLQAAEAYIAGEAADFRRAVRDSCERQREACAESCRTRDAMMSLVFAEKVRATPLVTEVDWWTGDAKP